MTAEQFNSTTKLTAFKLSICSLLPLAIPTDLIIISITNKSISSTYLQMEKGSRQLGPNRKLTAGKIAMTRKPYNNIVSVKWVYPTLSIGQVGFDDPFVAYNQISKSFSEGFEGNNTFVQTLIKWDPSFRSVRAVNTFDPYVLPVLVKSPPPTGNPTSLPTDFRQNSHWQRTFSEDGGKHTGSVQLGAMFISASLLITLLPIAVYMYRQNGSEREIKLVQKV